VLAWGLAAVASASCSLATDLSGLGGDDASIIDATPEAASDSFVLTAKPAHVTLDPKDPFDIEIDIVRGASFTEIVDVTVNDVGGLSGIDMTPQQLTFTASDPVKLHLAVQATAPTPQDGTIKLVGISRMTQKSQPASFAVRVGSVLVDTQTSTTVTVPSYATSLTIKAWGAGGGAGGSQTIYGANNGLAVGGFGGGGGMSGAIFSGSPGASLVIVVGGAGTTYGGGSGGGFTSVALGTTPLLVAGGGGGGGQGHGDASYCNTLITGGNGLAGGGANGQTSALSATITAGGAAGDSNATSGTLSQGGNGALPQGSCKFGCADGGAPGGGRAGAPNQCNNPGGGGGGGGLYGGGGGASAGGGGGGSGFVTDAGADVIQAAGSGASAAATSDPDYQAGSATGGAAKTVNAAVAATPGRVIVRLSKP
jgi:hypothetical protein